MGNMALQAMISGDFVVDIDTINDHICSGYLDEIDRDIMKQLYDILDYLPVNTRTIELVQTILQSAINAQERT